MTNGINHQEIEFCLSNFLSSLRICANIFKVVTLVVRYDDFSTFTRSKTVPVWTSDIFVIKRTASQLLTEFIGRQKLRLVGIGVTRLREIDDRQMLITDFV
jgi:DNA polymerase IV (archaeal DinB-like DNA polymerase)